MKKVTMFSLCNIYANLTGSSLETLGHCLSLEENSILSNKFFKVGILLACFLWICLMTLIFVFIAPFVFVASKIRMPKKITSMGVFLCFCAYAVLGCVWVVVDLLYHAGS